MHKSFINQNFALCWKRLETETTPFLAQIQPKEKYGISLRIWKLRGQVLYIPINVLPYSFSDLRQMVNFPVGCFFFFYWTRIRLANKVNIHYWKLLSEMETAGDFVQMGRNWIHARMQSKGIVVLCLWKLRFQLGRLFGAGAPMMKSHSIAS